MDILTIIYTTKKDAHLFQAKATHFLPEESFYQSTDIYQPPNIIVTCNDNSLELIKTLITTGNIKHDKIIWINAIHPGDCIAYLFNSAGDVNNFFKV